MRDFCDIAITKMRDKRPVQNNGVTMAKKKKKIVRLSWSKADVKQLKSLAKAKTGVTKTAKALKRTPAATANMATKLGVSLSMRG